MSNPDLDKDFRRLVDTFIHLANEHLANAKREHVGMALLYAAARFNSFVVAAQVGDLPSFDADRQAALEFLTREYQRMLTENLDDHRKLLESGAGKYEYLKTQH